MRHGPLVFLAALFALSLSWFGFVLTPQVQLGRLVQETNSVMKAELYPMGRPGEARQGLEVYRANGCVYCHSQQVQQKATLVNVVLTDAGKNSMAVADLLNEKHLGNFSGPSVGAGLPKTIVTNTTIETATVLQKNLKDAGAAVQLHLVPIGPDIDRGWGMRRTVAQDFLGDARPLPGSLRVGPDLANEGARHRDLNWQYVHLYQPNVVTPKSPMPAYKFLFERRKIENGKRPSVDALLPMGEFKPEPGYEIVPKPEAKALVAYLTSLNVETPLYEAPMTPSTPAAPSTNAPAK
jgi:cbb3-type cytochrome oxidase cytochrome c subunit